MPGPNQNCGHCFYGSTDAFGILRCCVHAPTWQRTVQPNVGPPSDPAMLAGTLTNWPIVMATDWCGQGQDAVTGAAYLPIAPSLVTTVAQLGAAAPAGQRAVVTDATGTTFNAVVVGAGSNTVPVYSDGTAWRIG